MAGTPTTSSQLRWAARGEAVRSLDDLMLRRTRLGLLLPHGGAAILDDVARICADELGWDAQRWQEERAAYQSRVADAYGVPAGTRTVSAHGTASTVSGSGPTGSPSA